MRELKDKVDIVTGGGQGIGGAVGPVGPEVGSVDAGWGAAWLRRHIGDRRTREMWSLDEQYSARQAYEMGLVNEVAAFAELDASVEARTDILAERSANALSTSTARASLASASPCWTR